MVTFENKWTPGQVVQICMLALAIISGGYVFFGQVEANVRDIVRLQNQIEAVQKETVSGDKRLTRIEDKIDLVIDRLAPARAK